MASMDSLDRLLPPHPKRAGLAIFWVLVVLGNTFYPGGYVCSVSSQPRSDDQHLGRMRAWTWFAKHRRAKTGC